MSESENDEEVARVRWPRSRDDDGDEEEDEEAPYDDWDGSGGDDDDAADENGGARDRDRAAQARLWDGTCGGDDADEDGGDAWDQRESSEFVSLDAVKARLAPRRDDDDDDDEEEEEEEEEEDDVVERLRRELTCSICLGLLRDPIALRCGHAFCRECCATLRFRAGARPARCPDCRAKLRRREDEETPTCVALRNACRLVRTPRERREDRDTYARRAAEDRAERARADAERGGGVGEVLVAATARDPPTGWTRVRGFGRRLVVATRNVRREGASHRLALALRVGEDALAACFDGGGLLTLNVALLRVEDDEDETDGGIPWALVDEADDALVATDQRDRGLTLEGENTGEHGGPWSEAATLTAGEAPFADVDVWAGARPWAAVAGDWLVLEAVDDDAGLELRVAFHRRLDDAAAPGGGGGDDDDSDSDRESAYESDGGFVVDDDAAEEEEPEGGDAANPVVVADDDDDEAEADLGGGDEAEADLGGGDEPEADPGSPAAGAAASGSEEEEELEAFPRRRKRARH